ncbi:UPF0236 family transposase-like protein [Mycoplasmopsis agassizii]|uniref:Transposase IS30-like HTH domain-containing protein n=1 Tax=Mycoplasmopsis agassizii TaxID=33922 RepID=A0ABX4H6B4_9BACT|nr:UPF0236 family protein [Mycoplasmopsis agassizii]PAF55362.1 hypothetical protein CJF60_01580 [Mycoplasmopsis agassizii]SMC20645.1 Uncharacterised protein family (UPF0236) [Mycoplasmopsis agassizii]
MYNLITKEEIIAKIISNINENEDYVFKNFDSEKYRFHGWKNRTLITSFGKVHFKRRRYACKETGKTFYFEEQNKYINDNFIIAKELEHAVLEDLKAGASYREIGAKYSISYRSVGKINARNKGENLGKKCSCSNDEKGVIYLEIDDTYAPIKDTKKK